MSLRAHTVNPRPVVTPITTRPVAMAGSPIPPGNHKVELLKAVFRVGLALLELRVAAKAARKR